LRRVHEPETSIAQHDEKLGAVGYEKEMVWRGHRQCLTIGQVDFERFEAWGVTHFAQHLQRHILATLIPLTIRVNVATVAARRSLLMNSAPPSTGLAAALVQLPFTS
jgi:hypothetical protein